MDWGKTIKLKHLLTDDTEYEPVHKIGNDFADILQNHIEFSCLIEKFRKIPKDNEWCSPVEAFNKLFDEVYRIADDHRIWID